MLLREVEYARPSSVEEAVRLLEAHEGARALAGGQTLINVMKARAASPDALVDLNRLDELRRISVSGDTLEIGAMATYTQIMLSSEVEVSRPILAEVSAQIADVQVRNRGTIGGNVCSNDPTNHLPPLLVALDATFTILGSGGQRTVSAADFFLGVYLTAVAVGELLTSISLPAAGRAADGFASVTLGRDGTCLVSAAATLEGGSPRIAIGCVDAVPVLLQPAGDDDASIRSAVESAGLEPPSDVHASADYRRHLAAVCAIRARAAGAGARPVSSHVVTVAVNGESYEREIDARRLLIHFLRDDLDLTGSHIGCDTGNCGACSVILDGTLVKSCMLLAVQADGAEIETVEGLAAGGELTPLQQAFSDHHGLQCGYCTPGMLMSATALLRENPSPSEDEVRKGLQGNICRCTGYWNIFDSVRAASGQEVAGHE